MSRDRVIIFVILVLLIFSGCVTNEEARYPEEYKFSVSNFSFAVGDDADRVVSMLGKANYFTSAPSCAGVGNDELYVYSGFKLTAHRSGGGAVISAIELTNDRTSTVEGVCIGDSEEKIVEAYGNGERFSGGIEFYTDNCRLRFFVREGRVTGIKYLQNDE